jgi:hypothetical protein
MIATTAIPNYFYNFTCFVMGAEQSCRLPALGARAFGRLWAHYMIVSLRFRCPLGAPVGCSRQEHFLAHVKFILLQCNILLIYMPSTARHGPPEWPQNTHGSKRGAKCHVRVVQL